MIAALVAAAALSAQDPRIDSIVEHVMIQLRVPGLSLAVARGGSTLYLRGYGTMDAGEPRRPDGFTIYAAGSIAKQFTAALVLQDVRRGALSLDGGNPPVRALLSHTVGDGWRYDNANYARLQEILERTGGAPYCALLTSRVLRPLHLFSTSCGPPAARNVATGSSNERQVIAPAAGGVWTNAVDLVRWLDALRSCRVVDSALFSQMTSTVRLSGGVPAHYGYGFFVTDWFGYAVAYHDGFFDGFSSIDAISPGDGLELAILTNARSADLVPLAKSVFAIFDPPRDVNSYASPSAPPENENARVTAALRTILGSSAFAPLGPLQDLEFLERSHGEDLILDRYRATFSSAVRIVTIGYGRDESIRSLRIEPAT